jgi:hypothetical protein
MHQLLLPFRTHLTCLATVLAFTPVWAATASGPSEPPAAIALHQQQRAACTKVTSAPERANCNRRADAALAEALRAQTEQRENPAALAQNAMRRCQAQPMDSREACERIARGEGSTSGSVEAGATVKELTIRTVEPGPDPAAPPASSPAPAPR